MSQNLIETVREAIKSAIDNSPYNFGERGVNATCEDAAKAAILATLEAIREPSEYAVSMGQAALIDTEAQNGESIIEDIWHAMIDALRAEIEAVNLTE
jgi:hypothetical protein